MTVSDDYGHHVELFGDRDCADHWCAEHAGWHTDDDEEAAS